MIIARQGGGGFGDIEGWCWWDDGPRGCGLGNEIHCVEERERYAVQAYRAAWGLPIPTALMNKILDAGWCSKRNIDGEVADYGKAHPGDTAAGQNIEHAGTAPDTSQPGGSSAQDAELVEKILAQGQQGKIPGWVWGVGAGVGGLLLLGVMAVALRRPAARAA